MTRRTRRSQGRWSFVIWVEAGGIFAIWMHCVARLSASWVTTYFMAEANLGNINWGKRLIKFTALRLLCSPSAWTSGACPVSRPATTQTGVPINWRFGRWRWGKLSDRFYYTDCSHWLCEETQPVVNWGHNIFNVTVISMAKDHPAIVTIQHLLRRHFHFRSLWGSHLFHDGYCLGWKLQLLRGVRCTAEWLCDILYWHLRWGGWGAECKW